MAINGVLRPGFVQIRVLEMEPAIKHYHDIVGLNEVSREADGRVYMKAYDEFDRHSVILREADQAGMDVMGWKVDSPETLAKFKSDLEAYGVSTETIPAGEQPGMGERVRFVAPTGHTFDLYAECELSDNGPMVDNPDVWREAPHGAAAIRFDHCLLYGRDIDALEKLFVEVLGFRVTEVALAEDGEMRIATFLSCSTKAHDLAVVRHDEDNKFHHASFLLEDWNAIGHAADLMTRYDVSVDIGPTRHGITRGRTIYFWDPSGNRNEVFAGGYEHYPDNPLRQWKAEETGKAIFYYERAINDTFLAVVT
jgi:catechol 2,3-dioxygenase